jgi:pilus assembly protein FimV
LNSDDLALPDLEPVTMSEVGTKLDLARAYMDMGDPDGAKNILEEVLHEGSMTQKQEAQRLMESLPG